MALISEQLSAAGSSSAVLLKPNQTLYYSYSGTHAATVDLEYSVDKKNYIIISSDAVEDSSGSGTYINTQKKDILVRFNISAYTSGDVDVVLVPKPDSVFLVNAAGQAKVGATAGFVVAAAANTALVTCPASQTAATCVIPVPHLGQGKVIKGFHLVGQVESAGNTATVDCALRKHTAAAADVADAAVASMAQVSCTADTILSYKNTLFDGINEIVGEDETFYFLVTVTTAASTDVALQGVALMLGDQ